MQAEKAKEAERLAKENPQAAETTEVVGENNVTALDAKKALGFLKLKMRRKGE